MPSAPFPGATNRRIVSALILAGLTFCRTDPRPADQDVEEIRRLAERYVAAHNAGDIASIIELYAEDGIVLPPESAPRNKAQTRRALRTLYRDVIVEEESRPVEIQVWGDRALDRGITTGVSRPKAGGESVSFNNKYLRIWRRNRYGEWKITHTMFNRNQ